MLYEEDGSPEKVYVKQNGTCRRGYSGQLKTRIKSRVEFLVKQPLYKDLDSWFSIGRRYPTV